MVPPKISVITPSYNQARFLERTIRSVLDQGYPNLEYIIIDGGSTDESVAIIEKYAKHLAYWVSEPDRGQTHAINKGLKVATGEWVGWQNSDDIFYPPAFWSMSKAVAKNPGVQLIIGDMMLIDEHDREIRDIRYVRPTYRALLAEGMVLTNQAAFWRRSVHDEIGFLDERLHYGFDYEWFLRLTQRYKAHHVNKIWGGLRLHGETKSSTMHEHFEEEYRRIRRGRELPSMMKHLYQVRRLMLMLIQGNVYYVLRGFGRRGLGREAPYAMPGSRNE